MYHVIKRGLKKLIPRNALFKYEPVIRSVYGVFYSGNNYVCNICGKNLRKFVELNNGNRICPKCGSSGRDRRLLYILESGYLRPGIRLLDFSPLRSLYRYLKQKSDIRYISTDLSGDFISDKSYNITDIDAEPEAFDLIICYHILEHVNQDTDAMGELFRVLKKDGAILIQTPFKEGYIYENSSITSEEGRLMHFGQEDHVRIYSVSGLKKRLKNAGFKVQIQNFAEERANLHGFHQNETILICTK